MVSRLTINAYGIERYYNKEGQYHRLDGPAVTWPDGDKEWYKEGKLHRLDGPAVEGSNGYKAWRVEGKRLSEQEFNLLYLTKE